MGYTHYWTFRAPVNSIEAAKAERLYQLALIDCVKAIRSLSQKEGGLSGYSAHEKAGLPKYGGIKLNGSERTGIGEEFTLRALYSDISNGTGRDFCKTNRHGYDKAVTACLCILKYRLKDLIEITSDGTADDWLEGLDVARTTLRRKVQLPCTIREHASRIGLKLAYLNKGVSA